LQNTEAGFKLTPGKNGDVEEETQEQLNNAYKNLTDLMGSGSGTSMVTMSKQDMSLMKQILTSASEAYKEQVMWRLCDFLDEEEALDHVNAFYEAKDLGMDTGYNVAYMYALVSANRKTNKTNLMSQVLDALQYSKWSKGNTKGSNDGNKNPRSPIG
jgi:hypothetical protein